MGILKNTVTHAMVRLRSCHCVGRNPNRADTVIFDKDISNVHGLIQWDGSQWLLLDHSRNGIRLNQRMLRSAPARFPLQAGDLIQFGARSETGWWVEDVSPPVSMLLEVGGNRVIELANHQHFANDYRASLAIYFSSSHGWQLEQSGHTRALNDGELIEFDQRLWRFIPCPLVETTREVDLAVLHQTSQPRLLFHVSLNEEHVQLQIQLGKRMIQLGERVHHYCLLLLARKRLEDANKGFELHHQGWIKLDALAAMLGQSNSYINIQIFRLRSQLTQALGQVQEAPELIERRRNELRLGPYGFEVYRGSKRQCHYDAIELMNPE